MNDFTRGFKSGAFRTFAWLGWPIAAASFRHPFLMFFCYSAPVAVFAVWMGAQYGDWSVAGAFRFLAAYWLTGAALQLAARPAHIWLARH